MLTIVILSYNTKGLLEVCLKSIFEREWKYEMDVWVVDNASADDSSAMVKKKFPQVKVIDAGSNLGFAGGNNIALKKINSTYCLLLNSDTEVLDGSLDKLIEFMDRGNYGIGTCKLLNLDKSFQPNTGDLPFGLALLAWVSGLDDLPIIGPLLPSFHKKNEDKINVEVGWVSGTAMMIRKDVIEKVGLLDDALFMYAEDTDYCIRARKSGFKIGWTGNTQIMHLGGGSSKDSAFRQWVGEFRGLLYIYKKYFGFFAEFCLRLLFYIFICLRMVAFLFLGKVNITKTYARVLLSI